MSGSVRRRTIGAALVAVAALVVTLLSGPAGPAVAADSHASRSLQASSTSSTASAASRGRGVCGVARTQLKRTTKNRKRATKRLRTARQARPRRRARIVKLRKRVRVVKRNQRVARARVRRLCRTATLRVSVSSKGAQANGETYGVRLSGNDRFAVFTSEASNLVRRDTNGQPDAFVHDLLTRRTTRVSVSSTGAQGNAPVIDDAPAVSADGRVVAFTSAASNLVAGDTNDQPDVFVRDRRTGTTTRVSVATGGAQAAGMSHEPAISADGRYVAFTSDAANLTPHRTGDTQQVYLHDRRTKRTVLVSQRDGVPADGRTVEPAISADGRWVAYSTEARNFGAVGATWEPDVYVWDRTTGRTVIVSTDAAGRLLTGWSVRPAISADGQVIAFARRADLLTGLDVTVVDRRVAPGNAARVQAYGGSRAASPTLSASGRLLAHVDGNAIVVRNRRTGVAQRADVSRSGAAGEGWAGSPSLSADGRSVAFVSTAANLVGRDGNGVVDAFVRRRR